jgi:hypothetical protein
MRMQIDNISSCTRVDRLAGTALVALFDERMTYWAGGLMVANTNNA